MAITAVNLVRQRWEDAKDGSRSYIREYNVHSNTPSETMVAVRLALPLNWTGDPVDGAAIVVTREAEQDEKVRTLWHGVVTWTWEPTDEEEEEDPLDREPAIDWKSHTVMVPAEKDKNGDAIVNSAGDYYDPPPEVPRVRWIATIEFNATSLPANLRSYAGAVNSGAITIDGETIAAERAMVLELDIPRTQYHGEDQTPYKTIRLSIECRDDDDVGYDLDLLDQGYRIKEGGALVDVLITDEDGDKARPSAPILLNGSGGRLADPSPTTAVFNLHEIVNLKDLTVFPGIS